MSAPSPNETWIIEAGDDVIQKKAREGFGNLTALEKLIYCVWVSDYGMRNAGDLDAAYDVYSDFQVEAAHLANALSLNAIRDAFALRTDDLQRQYFERFDDICDELKNA